MKITHKIVNHRHKSGRLPALLWCCWFLFITTFSSSIAAKVDNLRLTPLSQLTGLATNHLNNLLIDNEGLLWLATDAGLNRFDGHQVLNIGGPNGIFNGHSISYLFQDSTGLLWINDADTGLYTLDLTTKHYQKILNENVLGEQSDMTQVNHIIEQENGDLWIASTQNLRLYNRDTGNIEVVFSINKLGNNIDFIRRLLLDKNHLYIASSLGVFVFDINSKEYQSITHTPYDNPAKDQLNATSLYLKNNTLWMGTVGGLFSIKTDNMAAFIKGTATLPTPKAPIQYRNIWRLVPQGDLLYVATDKGLLSYNIHTDSTEKLWAFSDDPSLDFSDDNIIDIAVDQQGHFWLASRSNGAFYWLPKTAVFRSVYQKQLGTNQLSHNQALSVVQTDDNFLWVGTDNGLNKINLTNWQVTGYLVTSQSLTNHLLTDINVTNSTAGTIYRIMKGDNGILWLSTGDLGENLKAFDSKTGLKKPLIIANAQTRKVLAQPSKGFHLDDQGTIWFSTDDHFYRYDTHKGTVETLTGLEAFVSPILMSAFLGAIPGHDNSMMLYAYGQLWLYNVRTDQAKQVYTIPGFSPQDDTTPDNWVTG